MFENLRWLVENIFLINPLLSSLSSATGAVYVMYVKIVRVEGFAEQGRVKRGKNTVRRC